MPDSEKSPKFYLSTVVVKVISDRPLHSTILENLENLGREIFCGDSVGQVAVEERNKPVDGKTAADTLYDFGSEPAFFQLDNDGNQLKDENDENDEE